MTSNYLYGGPGFQAGNMLSLKNLSIAPHPIPQMNDSVSASLCSPSVASTVESGIGNTYRSVTSRLGIPDFLTQNIGSSNNRPSVLSSVSGACIPGAFNRNGQSMKFTERLGFSPRLMEPENHMYSGQRPRVTSASRVLSNLHDSRHQPFVNNVNCDVCAAFVSSRFGGGGYGGVPDGVVSTNPVPQTSSSSSSGFDNGLSSSQSIGQFLHSTMRQSVPSHPHSHILGVSNSTLSCQSNSSFVMDAPPEINLSALGDGSSPLSNTTTQYYSNPHLENTKKLQASGVLKAAPWILVPPVPEGTAAHMRTGRFSEFKSTSNDVNFSSSSVDVELKQVLHNKLQAYLFTCDESITEKLPRTLGAYTDLVPLEVLQQPRTSVTFNFPGVCFKAWSPRFNRHMLLRRTILPDDHKTSLSPDAYYLAKQLCGIDHPAIVGFRDIFFTNAFGDNSAIVVYEYIPCSSTLQQTHMSDPMKLTSFSSPFNVNRTVRPHSAMKNAPSDLGMPQEATVWSYLIQLTNGLRFIHQQLQQACGVLDPTKVLIQDGTRLRINCFGLKDILFHSSQETDLGENQVSDFILLGKLLLGVACGTIAAIQASQRAASFNLLQRAYRPELVALIRSLVAGQITGVDQLICACSTFTFDHITQVYDHSDFLERQLFLEIECDRLFRLICKLQSIVERSDRHGVFPEWAETGDRYMLKLFRDFVFHQSDQLGAPYLDLAHIITTLNKVEAGSSERVCLVSRDSQNIIIVTYADIKQWLDTSFAYLMEKHRQSRCEIQLARQQQQAVTDQVLNESINPGIGT